MNSKISVKEIVNLKVNLKRYLSEQSDHPVPSKILFYNLTSTKHHENISATPKVKIFTYNIFYNNLYQIYILL